MHINSGQMAKVASAKTKQSTKLRKEGIKMKKQILSMLLIVCMVFGMMPTAVFATENNVIEGNINGESAAEEGIMDDNITHDTTKDGESSEAITLDLDTDLTTVTDVYKVTNNQIQLLDPTKTYTLTGGSNRTTPYGLDIIRLGHTVLMDNATIKRLTLSTDDATVTIELLDGSTNTILENGISGSGDVTFTGEGDLTISGTLNLGNRNSVESDLTFATTGEVNLTCTGSSVSQPPRQDIVMSSGKITATTDSGQDTFSLSESTLTVCGTAELNLTNTSGTALSLWSDSKLIVKDNAQVTLVGGKTKVINDTLTVHFQPMTADESAIVLENSASLMIKQGVNYTNTGLYANKSTLTMDGTPTLDVNSEADTSAWGMSWYNTPLTLTAGTVKVNTLYAQVAINITGGDITAKNLQSHTGTGVIAISGGTISAGDGSPTLIKAKTGMITGGNVNSNGNKDGIFVNDATPGQELALYTFTITDKADTVIDNLTLTPAYTYGMSDVTTNQSGKLYLWLPENQTKAGVTIDGIIYEGTITDHMATLAPPQVAVDTSSIDTAIAAANTAKIGIIVNDSSASSVTNGTKFVTTAEMEVLTKAITTATNAKSTVTSTAQAQVAAAALDSVVATFKAVIKTGIYVGGSGGSSSSGSGNSSNVIITPPPQNKPNNPTEAEIKVDAKVNDKGHATIDITNKNINDAFNKVAAETKKNPQVSDDVILVLNVNTSGKTASSITVNLPKSVQEKVITKKIVNTIVVMDQPDVAIGVDLAAMTEIHKQAQADVSISATRLDGTKLTGEAKSAIGNRPAFDLNISYNNSKSVTNFGTGSVTIAIPYILQSGEKASNIHGVYVDENGKVQWLSDSLYDSTEQMLTFATNHFSTYGVGYQPETPIFTDITGHWAKDDINFVVARGLLSGTSTTSFSPDTPMTRGMFVTALGRLAGIDQNAYQTGNFTDINADSYYAPYINWATAKGIVSGITPTTFAPNQAISRQEMAVIMQSYAKATSYTLPGLSDPVTFSDTTHIASWASEAVQTMQTSGIIAGKDNNRFDPTGTATRAEASAILHRYVKLVMDSAKA